MIGFDYGMFGAMHAVGDCMVPANDVKSFENGKEDIKCALRADDIFFLFGVISVSAASGLTGLI